MDRMLALMGSRNQSLLGLLGFHFTPTDQEILQFYLHQLVVQNQPLPPPLDNVVRRCDLFGNVSEPSVIWTDFGGDQIYDLDGTLYFYSKLKKKGCRVDRKIGQGKWSETEPYKDVSNDNNNPKMIGRKRKFRYENEAEEGDHGCFLLEEFSLFDHHQKDRSKNPYDFDYVICRMKRNEWEDKSKNQRVQKPANKRKRASSDDQSEEQIINPTSKKLRKNQTEKKVIKPRNRKGEKNQPKADDSVIIDDSSTTATPSEPSELADPTETVVLGDNQFLSEQHGIDQTEPLPTHSVGLRANSDGVALGDANAIGYDKNNMPSAVNDINYLALLLEDSNAPTTDDIFTIVESAHQSAEQDGAGACYFDDVLPADFVDLSANSSDEQELGDANAYLDESCSQEVNHLFNSTEAVDDNQLLSEQHGIDETEHLPTDSADMSASSDGLALDDASAVGYDNSNRPAALNDISYLALVLEGSNAPTLDDIFPIVESANQSAKQDGVSAYYFDDVLNQPPEESSYVYTMPQQSDTDNCCYTPAMDQEVDNEDFYFYTCIDDD